MRLNNSFKIHFIGILGNGMSVLAKYLKSMGFDVAGSDITKNKTYYDLIKNDISVYIGHLANNVTNADIVIYSSSISKNNVEYKEAVKLNKAIYKRAELLSIIISTFKNSVGISGSHGKTTCSAMAMHILKKSLISYTALIGGNDSELKNYIYSDNKDVLISEICEYDKNIDYISSKIAVVLNIDNDHLDSYSGFYELKNSFYNYLNRAKYKIVCADDENLKNYKNTNVITFAINNKAKYRAENITNHKGKYSFTCKISGNRKIKVNLNVYGKHNIYNALANIAIFDSVFKFDGDIIKSGLESFCMVERRFEYLGVLNGVKFYSDYSHHPTEILESLKVYKEILNNDYTVIFQPHTFSRTKLLFNEFIKVFKNENVIIYNTYPAREKYIYLGSAKRLARGLKCKYIKNEKKLKKLIINEKYTKNFILLGAGNLYDIVVSIINNGL